MLAIGSDVLLLEGAVLGLPTEVAGGAAAAAAEGTTRRLRFGRLCSDNDVMAGAEAGDAADEDASKASFEHATAIVSPTRTKEPGLDFQL